MPRNVEVKIRVDGLEALHRRALGLGATDEGVLHQVDTYFITPSDRGARLKLREQHPGRSELIAYLRPDTPGLRASEYRVVPVTDPSELRDALAVALGVARRIAKSRHLLVHGRTRIHLDRVEGLGDFLELEVMLAPGEDAAAGEREANRVLAALDLPRAPRLPGSYADL